MTAVTTQLGRTRAQTQALELVAHNLANLATTGYRGEQTTFRSLLVETERSDECIE